MDATTNALNWFEIPASDINRAKSFYENIFGIEMQQMEMMGMHMAMFPWAPMNGKASGGLVQSDMHTPSTDGALIYLNANPDLADALSKVESAGGQVVMPKTQIDEETGYMAFFIDTEGNKVGLHSNN
ncbi:MAG: VOC family protein [Saprospiraceae bacterium]|nr:VOC family protein [Saprospiraceae bacterium]